MAAEKEGLKTLDFFCSGFLVYKGSYMHVMESNSALWVILGHHIIHNQSAPELCTRRSGRLWLR
jgi:hypothetical protein